jgi:pyruvate/2-oxoglutarate dehydrogenase complex dihydrolipoamide acyltransferase (E2) component
VCGAQYFPLKVAQGTLLKRLVEEGSYGTVGDEIAYIGDPEDLTALETESTPNKPAADDLDVITPIGPTTLVSEPETTPSAQADSSNRTVKATPAAKKEARDRGLDLAEVHRCRQGNSAMERRSSSLRWARRIT